MFQKWRKGDPVSPEDRVRLLRVVEEILASDQQVGLPTSVGFVMLHLAAILRESDGWLRRSAVLDRIRGDDTSRNGQVNGRSIHNDLNAHHSVIEMLRHSSEDTFYTEWISRRLNPLLERACRQIPEFQWRAVASRMSKKRGVRYRLEWHARLTNAAVQVSTKVENRSSLIAPSMCSTIDSAGQNNWLLPETPHIESFLDFSTKLMGTLTGSFFDNSNPRAERNRNIRQLLQSKRSSELRTSARVGLTDVVNELLIDLERQAGNRVTQLRFVCTNTTVEQLGITNWEEEYAIRRLMLGTQKIIINKPVTLDCYRIFIIRAPKFLTASERLAILRNTLEENRMFGVRTILCHASTLPCECPYSYSDLYCVPGRLAFISVVPIYLLSKFQRDNFSDRSEIEMVDYFSHFCEQLISDAQQPNKTRCQFWKGGTEECLKSLLDSLHEY